MESAGSIPEKEAELRAEALSSSSAGIEVCSSIESMCQGYFGIFIFAQTIFSLRQITLPPLIEDVEGRKIVVDGIRKSRTRYRRFRSRLSEEVSQSSGEFLPSYGE